MTVGDRIREIRVSLEISQTELAKRAGYSDKTRISKIENSGNEISMKQVKRIAKALNVDSAFLMGWRQPEDTDRAKDIRSAYLTNTFKLSDDEVELIEAYRLLDETGKEYTRNFVLANVKKRQGSDLSKAVNK